MARISTYALDNDISPNDIVIGSEYHMDNAGRVTYKTRNYKMSNLQEFFGGGDFTAETPIIIEIDSTDGHRNWKHATQSLTQTTPSGITLYAKDNYAENTPETFSAITGVTVNTTGHLTGYALTEFTMPEEYSFEAIGDAGVNHSGSGSVDSQSQTINFEQTLTISGGDAWISTLSLDSAADKVSIYHNNVSRNNVSVSPNKQLEDDSTFKAAAPVSNTVNGVTTTTDAVVSDAKGHIIGEQIHTYILPDYKFNIAADSTNSPAVGNPAFTTVIDIHSTSGTALDTLNILASVPISSIITADDTITISHDEYTAKSIDTSAVDVLDTFTSDVYGHVTAITTRTLPTFGGSTAAVLGGAAASGGSVGLVPAPASTDILKFLRSDGDWNMPLSYTISTSNVAGNASSNPVVIAGATIGITDGTNTSSIKIQQGANVNIGSSAGIITISSTDTSYSIFTQTVAGLVPAPTSANTAKFLRGDATWAEVVQTSIVTTDGTFIDLTPDSATSGAVTVTADLSATGIGANTAAKQLQFLRGDNTWATPPALPTATTSIIGGIKLFNDNHPSAAINTVSTVAGRYYGIQTSGLTQGIINVPWVNTWQANSSTIDGYVTSGANQANKVWKTNASGVPAWRTDADTTYSEATSSSEGLMSTAHHDKLGGIEDNATADQTAAQLRTAIGSGNNGHVPTIGTAGHFLKHDGTFGLPSYTTNTDTNTEYTANSGVDLAGTVFSLDVTSTSSNTFFKIPFFNSSANALSRDLSSSDSIYFNPSSNTLSVKQISIGTTATAASRTILSTTSGANYLELINSTNNTGGRVILGAPGSFNALYSRNYNATAGREFRIIQGGATVITVATGGNTVFTGIVTSPNFTTGSDIRLKSEIEPIREGLEVIKQFTSYNYIKGGEKESGFIAQEVREVIPHTVYEDKEGMLSMSDRGVVAHMHKAILELEERLLAIENKLN